MEPVELQVGTFLMKGRLRVSTQAEMTTTLDIARTSWMSVYEVSVSNLCLPQMPAIQVPMVLVSPNHVAFAMA